MIIAVSILVVLAVAFVVVKMNEPKPGTVRYEQRNAERMRSRRRGGDSGGWGGGDSGGGDGGGGDSGGGCD